MTKRCVSRSWINHNERDEMNTAMHAQDTVAVAVVIPAQRVYGRLHNQSAMVIQDDWDEPYPSGEPSATAWGWAEILFSPLAERLKWMTMAESVGFRR